MAYKALPINLEEHRSRLLTLWKENMSDRHIAEAAERRFPWYYTLNPGGRPTTILLLDEDSNQIVGSGSFYPRKMVLDGARLSIGVLADFLVQSKHRTAGAAVIIQRALAESSRAAGVNFLAAYPNRLSEPIFKRVGYKQVGKANRWVKPLRSHKEMAKRVAHPLAAAAASRVVDFGLSALDLKRIARLSSSARKLQAISLDFCDERFDALWERAKTAHLITGERTSTYLQWRYHDFPSLKYRFFALTDGAGERISAYLTFYVNQDNAAIIGDLFSDELTDTLDALLLRFSVFQRRAGRSTVYLDYLGPDSLGERFRNIGFCSRPTSRSLFVYFDSNTSEDVQRLVSNPANWFTLDAEMDV